MGRPKIDRVSVFEVRVGGVHTRRFLSREEAWAFVGSRDARLFEVPATPRQLYRWGLVAAIPTPPLAPPKRKRNRSHPPRCPNCHAYWYGPGRPRKGQTRGISEPIPIDPLDYDGPDPSTLAPAPRPSDLTDRPDLAGLFDPRLYDELPEDY